MTAEPTRREVPTLDPGVTLLRRPSARSPALYELVLGELTRSGGRALWVDARSNASTYAITDRAADDRVLDRVRVARAFTAYQHHTLVERLVETVDPGTGLIVVPCTASLYRDDVPESVGLGLLDASLSILREVATTFDVPVLVTIADESTDLQADLVVDAAHREITATETSQGLRFDGAGFETQVYWREGYFQTTIPYWVDLFGCVCEDATEAPSPVDLPAPLEG